MAKQYVQIFGVKFKHPETGEVTIHKFLGPALMAPEDIKRNKGIEIEKCLIDTWFEEPYLFDPKQYDEDEDNDSDKPPER